MSLQYESMTTVPDETARVAQAVFPKGTLAMQVRDVLYGIYTHDDFADLFPARGQPALAAWRLALVTILQFIEGLPDRQAADAVRDRIAWKYALGLELTDQGFDFSVLSEFRDRLLGSAAEYRLLNRMLSRLRDRGLLKARGRQRTDSTHVLAAIRSLNRLTCVGETLRAALNAVATVAPEWLRLQITAEWFELYSRRLEDFRLPQRNTERQALAATIGAHGIQLLTAISGPTAPAEVCGLGAVDVLRRVWIQQYYAPDADGVVRWRIPDDLPPGAQLIVTPYDVDAHPGNKRSTIWTGYKVHLTETCEEELPNLITHVETTNAAQLDAPALDTIHDHLAAKHLLPETHIVDAGYVDSEHLVGSQRDHQVTLLGPVPNDPSWQAHAGKGFDVGCFAVDWEAQRLTCPAGAQSRDWKMDTDRHGQQVIHVQFDRQVCAACAQRSDCTRATTTGRELTLRPREQHIALQAARHRQTTAEFKAAYAVRAGVEGSLSQGVRIGGLRQARYRGLPKTRLQHILTAVGINIIRVLAWLAEPAHAIIPRSRFAALAPTNSVQTLVGAT
jgi:transposase